MIIETRISLFLVLIVAALSTWPATAESREMIFGISDTGSEAQFHRQNKALGQKITGLQTFHPWGNSLRQAGPRWRRLGVRPMLHISTRDDRTGREILTPHDIARGAGDDYLLSLNRQIANLGQMIWVRPLGEANRRINLYAPVNPNGRRRGWRHSTFQYIRAFRRISIIVKAGSRQVANQRLRRAQLNRVQAPGIFAKPRVKIVWSPLPGHPGLANNDPVYFWPGPAHVDIVATSFFSAWSAPAPLNRFYRLFNFGKPFIIAEWGLNSDDPRFVRQIFAWCRQNRRCRGHFFYRGYRGDRFDFRYHRRSQSETKRRLGLGPYASWRQPQTG